MDRQIEIKEESDPSSYFYFHPVIIEKSSKIKEDDIKYLEEKFLIEEGDIECFLFYFLKKYFDENLLYNRERYYDCEGYIRHFEFYLTDNFYTYETLEKMCDEILDVARLLEADYDNAKLDSIKEFFSVFYLCDREDPDYQNRNTSREAMQRHIGAVTDFYRRFVERLRKMMKNNPDTDLISVMGP